MNYKDLVLSGISKLINKPVDKIQLDDELQDTLELDSLDIVELLMDIEDNISEELDANMFENCVTVQDLINILDNRQQ
jgi:acyl carrier protein